jgi:hypothetical protein
MRKIIGWVLMVASFVLWGAIALVPLLDVSTATAASMAVGMLVASELIFLASLALLGKDTVRGLMKRFRRRSPLS